MAKYFQVDNAADRSIQIDDTFMNLECTRIGTLSVDRIVNEQARPYRLAGTIIVDNPEYPIIAFESHIKAAVTYRRSGNTHTIEVLSMSTTPFTLTYYVFTKPKVSVTTTFGLEIRNAQNQVIFGSARPYMRVIDYFEGLITDIPGDDPIYETTGVGGRKRQYPGVRVAVVPSILCWYAGFQSGDPGGDPQSGSINFDFMVASANASEVAYMWTNDYMYINTAAGLKHKRTQQYQFKYMVIDVTNFT